jgi:hypothetical protein
MPIRAPRCFGSAAIVIILGRCLEQDIVDDSLVLIRDVRAWQRMNSQASRMSVSGNAVHPLPIVIGGGEFIGRGGGRGRLPFAELLTEGGQGIRLRGVHGIFAPEFDKGLARVFGTLDGRLIGKSAALRASGFVG